MFRRRKPPPPPAPGLFAHYRTPGADKINVDPFVPIGITSTAATVAQVTGVVEDESGLKVTGTWGPIPRPLMDAFPRFTADRGHIGFIRPKHRSWLYRKVHAKRILREQNARQAEELATVKGELADEREVLDRIRRAVDPDYDRTDEDY